MKDFKNSVVYQIYPKSFNDSNNDGLGDLRGVVEKLDYLEGLGVDYIWLTPFFVSPQNDNGYDIADYYNIDPAYGTMEDFEALVEGATKRNIKIMLDMVFNHTSTHHVWFQKLYKEIQNIKIIIFSEKVKMGIRQQTGFLNLVETHGNMLNSLMNIIYIYLM